jgi:hypothetical protein
MGVLVGGSERSMEERWGRATLDLHRLSIQCFGLLPGGCCMRTKVVHWSVGSLVADNGPSNPSEAHLTLDPTDSNQRLMGLLGMLHWPHPWISYVARTKVASSDA